MRKADNLPPSRAVTKSGNLNFLEPCGPVQACDGAVLPFTLEHASALRDFDYFSVSVFNYIYCEIATALTSYMNIFVFRNVKPFLLGREVTLFRRYIMPLCVVYRFVIYFLLTLLQLGTAVAQWLRCCATIRKVACSIPAGVIGIFN